VQAAGDLARHARGLLGVLDGVAGLAKLFNFKGKQYNASSQAKQATATAAGSGGVPGSIHSSSRSQQAGLASSSAGQPNPGTTRLQPQPAGSVKTSSVSQQQQQQQQRLQQQQAAAAGPTAQQPFTWPEAADSTAYVHSWQPASPPSLAPDGSVRPPAQAFTQAPLQPLAALTTDPKDHTGPHPWDVLLFKVNQFNTTQPAYRLGGLGLMLMTDFNKSKPLTDWHVLDSEAQSAQMHAAQEGAGSKPQSSVGTASFVEGRSLVKPGLANVQQPARPYGGGSGQHAAAGAASVASTQAQQQQQQQQQLQQRRQGSAVGIASVGGGRTGGAAQPAQVMISQDAGCSAGSDAVSAGSKGSSSVSRFKPESMVALLTSALQRNMRMAAPGQGMDQPAEASDSSSSSSGITEVTMEATQLWCIACEEPAYLLSTAGYCGELLLMRRLVANLSTSWLVVCCAQALNMQQLSSRCACITQLSQIYYWIVVLPCILCVAVCCAAVCGPGYGRLMDSTSPYSCVKCPRGHISAMTTTAQQQQQGAPQPQQTTVQTCKPCPPGQGTNEAQTACGE
jgi:hypothetical protein